MRKSYFILLSVIIVFVISQTTIAQWINLEDQTADRLKLSSIQKFDGEEKDIAIGDLNRDGWMDIVVVRKNPFSNQGPRADLLLLNDRGKLVDSTLHYAPEFISNPSDARDVLIIDIDGDNWDDVIVCNTFAQQPILYHNLGNDESGEWLGLQDETASRFPLLTINPLQFCAVWGGDITGNGAPDIYFSNYNPSGLCFDVLLINDGTGNFTDETISRLGTLRNSAFGTSVEIHDADNDGDNDIVKISTLFDVPPWNAIGVFILFNEGTGTFSNWQKIFGNSPYMFTIGDLTNDLKKDVYTVDDQQDYVNIATNLWPDSLIDFNTSTLSNSPRTTGFGGNVKMADVDNDGDLDVGVASVDVDFPPCETGGLRKFTLLRNQDIASGTLMDPWGTTSNPWNLSSYDFAFLDINRDGNMDIFLGLCTSYAIFMQDPIDPPTNLSATEGDALVNLDWSPNPESDISLYVVYRNTTNDNLTADSIAAVIHPDTVYLDVNVINDTTYFYWITARSNNGDESYFSLPDSATPSSPIPVELIGFAATSSGNIVELEWQTATETNNYGFEIERTSPLLPPHKQGDTEGSGDWEMIGFIPGHGTTTEPYKYSFKDEVISQGSFQYRLKQIDYNGSFTYSDEVNIDMTLPLEFKLFQNFPNPFNPGTVISWQLALPNFVTLKIYDVLGSKVATLINTELQAGNYKIEFDGAEFPSGIYFYQLNADNFSDVKKMILTK
ncbi:MAG: VCBS repeat-containing protein [Bacteroidetes bacterium]|nr:VCBS repeat-containing protein [Bacteroidota bacterium]